MSSVPQRAKSSPKERLLWNLIWTNVTPTWAQSKAKSRLWLPNSTSSNNKANWPVIPAPKGSVIWPLRANFWTRPSSRWTRKSQSPLRTTHKPRRSSRCAKLTKCNYKAKLLRWISNLSSRRRASFSLKRRGKQLKMPWMNSWKDVS